MTDVVLSEEELFAITGYQLPTKQLNVLHRRGFSRAFIGRNGVVLERAHYDAVCRGSGSPDQPKPKTANLSFLRRA
ncbi:DUF4224 domain-containing protein [uncultured Xylophilus sp.]|uniref:DUF4224 domain-containing protein n=1 Tax=uncultured Xylophilus sp. TaxID=296832 RepID=UPI0025D953C5|nr:DUF4224 domain-containing protein [uncultured Xylophilus sp.]